MNKLYERMEKYDSKTDLKIEIVYERMESGFDSINSRIDSLSQKLDINSKSIIATHLKQNQEYLAIGTILVVLKDFSPKIIKFIFNFIK